MSPAGVTKTAVLGEIHLLARQLRSDRDLDGAVRRAGDCRFTAIGEASHGTHEFYTWRATLSRRLIEEQGYTWIGVEGDWPDCWRINQWVRGQSGQDQGVHALLAGFQRWPTWLWANEEVAGFLDWLRTWNARRPLDERVGFYGLDVYSLWDSLREIIAWLQANQPDALPSALRAWQCFQPHHEDPHQYAWSTRLVPNSCEADVVALLSEVRRRVFSPGDHDEEAFDAVQNAEVAANAEHYYRIMVRGDRQSWNVRDHHMADTVDRLSRHLGAGSRGIIWEHNTHIGDARGTDMARDGLVNVGQLLRERHAPDGVLLVGFAAHRGTVLAAGAWGTPERILPVPAARPGSHEDFLHEALGVPAVLDFGEDRTGPWLSTWLGHRAIGVVYHPEREQGNYVPTRMGERYDALIWLEDTAALRPLHHEGPPLEPEFETEPTGF
ncbi:erythromycin esterase family protein [Arthrobacter sp. Hor0625]|uniref:erythromycin esterase family protein n=1 Tax=Arthrobacter sp. Hor0625 TaxID=3457358 RepID=UPI00403E4D2D